MPEDILDKVISFISRDGEHGSDKDMLLRQIAKEIAHTKYAKFYRPRQDEADVSFAQFFFSVYKIIYPLQVFLKDPVREAKIKQITLEAFLDKPTMDLIKRLSPEAIAEREKSAGVDFAKQLEEDLSALVIGFDSRRIAKADKCYNLIAFLKQFVFFDYCSLLRKFDPEIIEGEFITQPKFSPVDIIILARELTGFLAIMPSFDIDEDWKTVFEILKYCHNRVDVIPLAQWESLLVSLKDIKQSKIMELMSKLATRNPILDVKASIPHEPLSAYWLEQKTREIRTVINGITDSQRNAKISAMVNAVFGPMVTARLSYYNPGKSKVLIDKGLNDYVYASALNYLATFIQEFICKEIHELCDILLVRGQWTNNAACRQMSDSFHDVNAIITDINALDESLAEDGSNGPRLRGALLRVDRDRAQARYINTIISSVNEEALHIINKAISPLIVVGKHFKMLMEDCEKKPFELIRNWRELSAVSKVPISQRISAAYKKINYFVQLMRLEICQPDD